MPRSESDTPPLGRVPRSWESGASSRFLVTEPETDIPYRRCRVMIGFLELDEIDSAMFNVAE
jgi:hypothetical protein